MAILDRATLAVLIAGTTHVLDRGGKEAYVHFASDDVAHMLLDDGEVRTGKWALTDDGYSVDWDNGSIGNWQLDHQNGAITYVNMDRDVRVKLLGVLFGNAKGLPRAAA